MKERFIKILKAIDQQYFETTINKLQSYQLTPDSAFGDIYDKAQLVNIVAAAITSAYYEQQNLWGKFLIQLLFDTSNLEYEMKCKHKMKNLLSKLYEIKSNIERLMLASEIGSFSENYYPDVKQFQDVTKAFIDRYASFNIPESSFIISQKMSQELSKKESYSFVDQEEEYEFNAQEDAPKYFGTQALGSCVGFCITGNKIIDNQKSKVIIIAHFSSNFANVINQAKEELQNVQVCLIGGDLASMHEYLPLLCNKEYPEITAARLCLSDADFCSGFFTELKDGDHYEISYVIYPPTIEPFPNATWLGDSESEGEDSDCFNGVGFFSHKRPFAESAVQCPGASAKRNELENSASSDLWW
jgi:hypothetical protein